MDKAVRHIIFVVCLTLCLTVDNPVKFLDGMLCVCVRVQSFETLFGSNREWK